LSFLSKVLGIRALSIEDPAQPLLPYSALFESLGLGRSDAGNLVNETQALRLTTMYACVNIISQDISSLPFLIYEELADGSMREAKEHRLTPILSKQPNASMTSSVFRAALLANALAWGNGYAYIRRDQAQRVKSLHILPAARTSPVMLDGQLWYATTATKDGGVEYVAVSDMIHLRGLSLSGEVGLSPVQTCKNAFGLSLAQESFSARFYGNGLRTTGVLQHPEHLDAEAYENLKKSIYEVATGENAMRPLILEEGMTWTQMSVAPNDAQFVESRNFQVREICSMFRVATTLVGDLTRATHSNAEQLSQDHIRYCLKPWAVRLEEEINCKLLSGNFVVEHNFNDFQRGDFASQTTGLKTLHDIGAYSANDVLRDLRKNPIPTSEGGDIHLAPLNMVPLDSLVTIYREEADGKPAVAPKLPPEASKERVIKAHKILFRDAIGRITNRSTYDEQFCYRALYPVIAAMAESVTDGVSQENFIAGQARALAQAAKEWPKDSLSTLADDITTATYEAICQKQN
jgi:HK97 family phage portal protein